jgi:hypothetical protein
LIVSIKRFAVSAVSRASYTGTMKNIRAFASRFEGLKKWFAWSMLLFMAGSATYYIATGQTDRLASVFRFSGRGNAP